MGQREDMLLALGVDPSALPADPRTTAAPMAPPGLVDALTQDAQARAGMFRKALAGGIEASPAGALAPAMPGIKGGLEAVGAVANPVGLVAGLAANPDVARRAGELALGLPRPREGVTTRTRDAEPGALRPMGSPDVQVNAAPTLAAMGSPAAPTSMGGGGGFGFGALERNLRDAQGRQLQTIGDAADLERRLGNDQALKLQGMSDTYAAHAAQLEDQAAEQRAIDALTAEKHDAFLARQEKLADDLAKQQVDPGRLLRNADTATQITFGLGAALSGGNAMLNGQNGNPFLDRIEKLVDRDVNAQMQDIDSKKASYSARQSLFGQMMAESGDRRLAAMQTRKVLFDAMAQKVLADGERLGIPIVKDQAAIVAQTFVQKSADLQKQIAEAALAQARAAAAAQVAAQRAAEERLRQHTIEMIKLQQEQQKIDISREGKSGDLQKQTQQLAEKLSDKDLAEGRGAVEAAKRRLMSLGPDEGLPGVGPVADVRAGLHPKSVGDALLGGVPGLVADKAFGLSDAERVSRGDWEKIKLAYQKQITGSGASEGERRMLTQAFEGARSPAEQRNAIMQADDYFSRREAAIKAGFDPAAVATYEQRQNAISPQLPPGAKERR